MGFGASPPPPPPPPPQEEPDRSKVDPDRHSGVQETRKRRIALRQRTGRKSGLRVDLQGQGGSGVNTNAGR